VLVIVGGVLFVEVGVVVRGGPVAEAPPLTTRAPVTRVFTDDVDREVAEV
jgi:hypothetical protein